MKFQSSDETKAPQPQPSGRPILRRVLFVLACMATLLALVYTVEKIRGRRAWENCRRELEPKEHPRLGRLHPPPVPDEQNIFKAPQMAEWFVKDSAARREGGPTSIGPLPPLRSALWQYQSGADS